MKLNKIKEELEDFFSLSKKKIEKNSDEIDEVMDKLIEKRNKIEKEIRECDDCKKKDELKNKLTAVNKLIQKALKNLY
ncbi:MAG: hypothetical protein ACNI25_06210 [Halarcobacter sp.]